MVFLCFLSLPLVPYLLASHLPPRGPSFSLSLILLQHFVIYDFTSKIIAYVGELRALWPPNGCNQHRKDALLLLRE